MMYSAYEMPMKWTPNNDIFNENTVLYISCYQRWKNDP